MAEDGTMIGVSKWDLDTPALCVDLDALERNIATMQSRLTAMGVASRPHAKSHKCPAIAKRQLAGGSIGICTAKVSEAEVFSASGIAPILMTTSNVTPNKIRRAMVMPARAPLTGTIEADEAMIGAAVAASAGAARAAKALSCARSRRARSWRRRRPPR